MTAEQNIVLDMDETLIHTFFDLSDEQETIIKAMPHLKLRVYSIQARDIQEAKGTGTVDEMLAVERPYVNQFLRFCAQRFHKVYIWSAGQSDYVHKHIRRLSRSSNINNVYTFDDCAIESDEDGGLIHKPFEKMGLDPSNTFIVDDRTTAYFRNAVNGICIPRYSPTIEELEQEADPAGGDVSLVKLMSYFLRPEVRNATDVRELYKNIFATRKTNATYPSDGDVWNPPGDGDCLFACIARALEDDKIFAHAIEQRLQEFRRRNNNYNMILARKPLARLLCSAGLRYAVAAVYFADAGKTEQYLEHCKNVRVTEAAAGGSLQWMSKFWDGTRYSTKQFLASLLDKTVCWGDDAAIDTLSSLLGVHVTVWDKSTKAKIYETGKRKHALCHINLVYDGSHYCFISDNYMTKILAPGALPRPEFAEQSGPRKKRRI